MSRQPRAPGGGGERVARGLGRRRGVSGSEEGGGDDAAHGTRLVGDFAMFLGPGVTRRLAASQAINASWRQADPAS